MQAHEFPDPKESTMDYLGYAALIVLAIVALITFFRSYKDYKNMTTGRTLVDLGLSLSAIFVMIVLAIFMSVSAQALVAGSPVIRLLLGVLLGLSLSLIVAGKLRSKVDDRKVVKKDAVD